jgi:hypothetical protein
MADFRELAKVLGVSAKKAEQVWTKVTLDGDERRSIGERFGLPCDDVGQNGDVEYKRGIRKLKAAAKTKTRSS